MSEGLLARVAALESALAESRALIGQLTEEREHLRTSHDRLRQELELLRRRIFIAKCSEARSAAMMGVCGQRAVLGLNLTKLLWGAARKRGLPSRHERIEPARGPGPAETRNRSLLKLMG